ncbi:MAG: hypothetical protein DMG78_17055 [Acidobacteria bacterium]|nr:MAG: hypothetical protein DMG78_17055 [Acidobacteriota bacterium]
MEPLCSEVWKNWASVGLPVHHQCQQVNESRQTRFETEAKTGEFQRLNRALMARNVKEWASSRTWAIRRSNLVKSGRAPSFWNAPELAEKQ